MVAAPLCSQRQCGKVPFSPHSTPSLVLISCRLLGDSHPESLNIHQGLRVFSFCFLYFHSFLLFSFFFFLYVLGHYFTSSFQPLFSSFAIRLWNIPVYLNYYILYILWRRQWHPTAVLLPGKSHGWRSLEGCSPWGRWELDRTQWLHFHFSLSCIGEGNGSPLQCSCLEHPRDGGAWWAAVYGVTQSRTRLKWLSSSSSSSSSRK